MAALPWSAGRAGLVLQCAGVLSLQLSSGVALLEKVGFCCCNWCVGLAAGAVHTCSKSSARPAACLKI